MRLTLLLFLFTFNLPPKRQAWTTHATSIRFSLPAVSFATVATNVPAVCRCRFTRTSCKGGRSGAAIVPR